MLSGAAALTIRFGFTQLCVLNVLSYACAEDVAKEDVDQCAPETLSVFAEVGVNRYTLASVAPPHHACALCGAYQCLSAML
jgi:hypothetical protein